MYHFVRKIETFSDLDKSDYSKFKHGSKSVARRYGKELADAFISSEDFEQLSKSGKSIVICSAPHNNIPTASFTLKDYFLAGLSSHLMDSSVEIEECKIYRKHSYTSEYGEMNAEERFNAISADTFHIDKDFVRGKHVIFVDDCRITGAHEKRIMYLIEKNDLDISYSFLYYAALVDGVINPAIENEINHFSVKSIGDITDLIMFGEFTFNTRVVKKILRHANISEFTNRMTAFNYEWGMRMISTLVTLATLNNYHKDETMSDNIKVLSEVIFDKNQNIAA